ncbi:hypothetical protein [Flavobacterium saccharophilum]|uniref:Uncharacterized protein n=1 Tax=Flavobacterium saccharophilum TaxID=29534 RepID=A0A1M7JFL5_9FLAO|nr:hypothetical protein [Flavobacterium saccharophilum]SHM51768.1 hypothetical protein SAMN05444366_3335 [Flavobacterium saccharophilum]
MKEQELNIKKLSFTQRPIPIPADYRPMYKIALIVLTLRLCCRAETSNLLKLHLFSWALSSDKNISKLKDYVTSNFQTDFSVWSIEPALNRALQYAIAENICDVVNGKNYKLTEKGFKFYQMINSDTELFDKEKSFLTFIGKSKITDSRINAMSNQWNINYAEN